MNEQGSAECEHENLFDIAWLNESLIFLLKSVLKNIYVRKWSGCMSFIKSMFAPFFSVV